MSKEVLSVAVDNAATAAEWDALLEAVGRDPEITAEWSRLWEWRDARDGVTVTSGMDFCSGVMAAIAREKPLPSNVVSMPQRSAPQPAARTQKVARSWRTLVPLSAAAGVVAAVLVVGGYQSLSTEGAAPPQIASSNEILATTPVSFAASERVGTQQDAAKSAILNAYLMEHSNSLAERSMGGTLANARFAARTADYRPDAP